MPVPPGRIRSAVGTPRGPARAKGLEQGESGPGVPGVSGIPIRSGEMIPLDLSNSGSMEAELDPALIPPSVPDIIEEGENTEGMKAESRSAADRERKTNK